MRPSTWLPGALALLSGVDAAKVCEGTGGLCYSSYTTSKNVTYRVAIPSDAKQGAAYDVVLSVIAPYSIGWAGFAWGGQMTNNPLTIGWRNGNATVVSARWAR